MNSKIRRHWPLAVAVDYLFAAAPKQTYISAVGDLRSAYRNDDGDVLSPPPWHTPTEVTGKVSDKLLLNHVIISAILLISVAVYWSIVLHCSYITMVSSWSILDGKSSSCRSIIEFSLNIRPESKSNNNQWSLGSWPLAFVSSVELGLSFVAQVRLQ